ncbi:hypothetical protein ACKI16_29790 [Streptomyces scabiei]|uniref:hypothetical protein n=1 Tax=Streptomyces scabiei TaxID=1930 RepID=UPI0038F6723D
MVTGWLLWWGTVVDSALSAVREWVPLLAVPVLLAAVLDDPARVRTPVRMLSGRIRIRRSPSSLTCPDAVRTRSVDNRPDASGHIPGGGP